jgi:cysteine desulfurase
MIYFDHRATTPLAHPVLEAMTPYMTEHWGNPSIPYRFGSDAKMAVESAHGRIAEYLRCTLLRWTYEYIPAGRHMKP